MDGEGLLLLQLRIPSLRLLAQKKALLKKFLRVILYKKCGLVDSEKVMK